MPENDCPINGVNCVSIARVEALERALEAQKQHSSLAREKIYDRLGELERGMATVTTQYGNNIDRLSSMSADLFQSTHPARGATANFTKEQRVCLAQFAYLDKGKKAEHTKTNAPMLHEAFLYAFWVRTGRRRRVLLDFARYKIKGSSGR